MSGTIEVLVFPRTYEVTKDIIKPDQIIVLGGKLDTNEETPILIASDITLLSSNDEFYELEDETLEITLPQSTDRVLLSQIYEILKSSPGDCTTYLIIPGNDDQDRKIPVPFSVAKTSSLEKELSSLGCSFHP